MPDHAHDPELPLAIFLENREWFDTMDPEAQRAFLEDEQRRAVAMSAEGIEPLEPVDFR
jgi:hypothetical protein